ncbi:MAG TPA: flagellar basal body rod protein FlgC [Novosphingobium sp.]
MRAMEISRTGLEVEWRRLEIIAENLANAQTVNTANGELFRPRHLVSGPATDFASYLEGGISKGSNARLAGVAVYSVEAIDLPPRIMHEPGNPAADADGNVAYPGMDQAAEMTLLVKTARTYQANMVAMNAARQMYSKALELGGRR